MSNNSKFKTYTKNIQLYNISSYKNTFDLHIVLQKHDKTQPGLVTLPGFVENLFVQMHLRERDAGASQRKFDFVGLSVEQYCVSYYKATKLMLSTMTITQFHVRF